MTVCAGCGKEEAMPGRTMGARCRFRLGLTLDPPVVVAPVIVRCKCGGALGGPRQTMCPECKAAKKKAQNAGYEKKRVRDRSIPESIAYNPTEEDAHE